EPERRGLDRPHGRAARGPARDRPIARPERAAQARRAQPGRRRRRRRRSRGRPGPGLRAGLRPAAVPGGGRTRRGCAMLDQGSGDEVARRSVLQCLGQADGPVGALEVARRAHLSTLVVIPILTTLAEEALVRRTCVTTGSGRRDTTWAYVLTGRGSR